MAKAGETQARGNQVRGNHVRGKSRLEGPGKVCVWVLREATEGLATAALAWLARILSSLLLKTASVFPRKVFLAAAIQECLLEAV